MGLETNQSEKLGSTSDKNVNDAPAGQQVRVQGKVKWFSNVKGFGFLRKEGEEKDEGGYLAEDDEVQPDDEEERQHLIAAE